jgi:hypothetical protein
MKKLGIFMFAVAIIVCLSSCVFNADTLTGTEWRFEFLGSGYGYKFDTINTGHGTECNSGVWTDTVGLDFTYTYDSVAKSGTISYGSVHTDTFTIEGRVMNMNSVQYTLK